jgi:3-oxoacyl-[acyl-carrier-protein] synthase-3
MTGASIAAVGAAVPATALSSAELEETLALPAGWIESRTGIRSRRIAGPSDDAVSLGVAAARRALDAAAVDPAIALRAE